MKNTKDVALVFLICCYFGQSQDLLKAAIDRAYVDMAAHTLTGFNDVNTKWKCRYNASKQIRDRIEKYGNHDNHCEFSGWNKDTINQIKMQYNNKKLTEGQAQKWLNMTIKYLFVFKFLIPEGDGRLEGISFLEMTGPEDYYPPVDTYVLKGSQVGINKGWSALEETEYKEIMEFLGKDKGFLWEFQNWESFKEDYSVSDKDSYVYYLKHRVEKTNIV